MQKFIIPIGWDSTVKHSSLQNYYKFGKLTSCHDVLSSKIHLLPSAICNNENQFNANNSLFWNFNEAEFFLEKFHDSYIYLVNY